VVGAAGSGASAAGAGCVLASSGVVRGPSDPVPGQGERLYRVHDSGRRGGGRCGRPGRSARPALEVGGRNAAGVEGWRMLAVGADGCVYVSTGCVCGHRGQTVHWSLLLGHYPSLSCV
jgi:hypothetical protein